MDELSRKQTKLVTPHQCIFASPNKVKVFVVVLYPNRNTEIIVSPIMPIIKKVVHIASKGMLHLQLQLILSFWNLEQVLNAGALLTAPGSLLRLYAKYCNVVWSACLEAISNATF